MRTVTLQAELTVVGGGLAGVAAAVAAAREGRKVVLIHDRPVFGGNASSEIRMWICGAHGEGNRETGIVEEVLLENLYRNPDGNYSIWDSVLYSLVRREPNITALLNTACTRAEMDGDTICAVEAYQSVSQTWYRVESALFADCSGDSVLAASTGAETRYGREGREEFQESIAPEQPDRKTMGMSCLLQARETQEPHDFIPPEWAHCYRDDMPFRLRKPDLINQQNFWWIELGGDGDALHDVDYYRDELLKIAFGVWDYLKNSPDKREKYRNWELEWVGFLPGKRETFRYVGDHIVTQHDVAAGGKFDDIIAYGGWTMDDHYPAGFNAPDVKPTIFHPAPSPFGLPYRAVYSKNVRNLFFAGRNISVTHSALSATRVMATCGVLGEAVGIAAALAMENNCTPREVPVKELQKRLMYRDCYLPGLRYPAPELTQKATLSVSTGNGEGLRKGLNRTLPDCCESWVASVGDFAEYRWETPQKVRDCRLVFDSNLNRKEKNIIALRFLNTPKFRLPETLVKKFRLECQDAAGKWHECCVYENHYRREVLLPLDLECVALRFTLLETHGADAVKIFAWTVA